jgi:hypothetical protein
MTQILFSVENPYRKVVDNFIILLVLKFDTNKSYRLGVMLFTNSVTESVPNSVQISETALCAYVNVTICSWSL